MLLPIRCAICDRSGASPCPVCVRALRRAPALGVPPGLDRCHAVLAFEGPARDLVARLKYHNARGALRWLAGAMAALVGDEPVDVVTWAPTTAFRRRHRGFDQGELLGRRVAAELGRPCEPLLVRRRGPPQTGRSRTDRWAGPQLDASRRLRACPPGAALLVDDIITTGASLSAAARTLRGAGVVVVIGLAAARTPAPPSRRAAG